VKIAMPKPRRWLTAVGVVITVAAAAVVWQNLPTPTDVFGPFDVHADAGTPAISSTALKAAASRRPPPFRRRSMTSPIREMTFTYS